MEIAVRLLLLCMFVLSLSTFVSADGFDVDEPSTSEVSTGDFDDEFSSDFGDDFEDDEDSDDFDEGFDEFDAAPAIYDPLEGYNRFMTKVNDDLFMVVLDPIFITGYQAVVPEPARFSIRNFFDNLNYPISLANNLLQLKLEEAGTETLRFIVNSTIGVLGLFDPADDWLGLESHKEDFGQTLGYWGVGHGFHLVLPILGPSNLRDFSGDLLDFYVNPLYYVEGRNLNLTQNRYQGWGLYGYKEFNKMTLYNKEYKSVRKDALDLYPFLRDAYELRRNKTIKE